MDQPKKKIIVNKLKTDAHWHWMLKGFETFRKSFIPSFAIGFAIVFISWAIVGFLRLINFGTLIPAAVGGFIFIAPLLATTIYNLARKTETEGNVSGFPKIVMQPYSKSQLGYIGFCLFFIIITWAIFTHLIWSMAVGLGRNVDEADFLNFIFTTPNGLLVLFLGGGLAIFLGIICFGISAVSLPMAFDMDIDALTAMALSVKALITNPLPMLVWAFMIATLVIISSIFFFVPFVIVFPWLGHATWCAYRELVSLD